MKLKPFVCFAAIALSCTPAFAALAFAPFLSVDVNGYNAGGAQTLGPTEAGFQGWEMAEGLFLDPSIDWPSSGAAGLTKVFATSEGNVTANLVGVAPNSVRLARNRGANTDALGDVTQDYVAAQRDPAIGFGRNYVKLTLSGLQPLTPYEFTAFARDHFNGGGDSFEAWTDVNALGGVDGPSAWLDANVGAGASYQPAPGGVNNPIPKLARAPISGPASPGDAYAYAATFLSTTNASGVLQIYGWSDPNASNGVQGAALLNGFQIGGPVPEHSTLALASLCGLLALAHRRK